MIVKRVELSLYGPDEYPSEEGSYEAWQRDERQASIVLHHTLVLVNDIMQRKLPEGFEFEITPPLDQSGELYVRTERG